VDDILVTSFRTWNEHDPEERRRLLERAVSHEAVLLDPTGRWEGAAGLAERIGRYHSAALGTVVVTASDVDAHNHVVRYAWKIVNQDGTEVMEGIDVAERDEDGRLRRILMFHGPPSPFLDEARRRHSTVARPTESYTG
jgi:hypothetical protein